MNCSILMKYLCIIVLLFLFACSTNTAPQNKNSTDTATTTIINTDTVPETRTTVNHKPIASYIVPVNDPKLGRTFGVEVYETPATFDYVMRMHYEAVEETDTLSIPNFGIWPEIKIMKGDEKVSCIIGFLDKKKTFRPYKKLLASGNQMKLIVLKQYFTGRYKTPGSR